MVYQNVFVRRKVIIGMHHRQREDLLHRVVFLGFGVAFDTFAADEDIRLEILLQHLPREVVVDAAIVK